MSNRVLTIKINTRNYLPTEMPRINSRIRLLLNKLGQDIVTSAKRSIQWKEKPAAIGRPPRNVTGKLKAGIDYNVSGFILYVGVKQVATSPPPMKGRRRRNVPTWLENRHPYLWPAHERIFRRLPSYLGRFSLT